MRTALLTLTLLLAAVAAPAQTIVEYHVQFYQPGVDPATGQPFATLQIPASAVACAPAPTPDASTAVVNPTAVSWDGATAGQRCQADASQFLLAVPAGGQYRATMTATNDAQLTSARSAASNPFTRVDAPAARTALRLTR